MNHDHISLDTNVFIFGLRNRDQYAALILKNMFRFDISISEQVERELRRNLTESEFRRFYDLMATLTTFHISYQPLHEDVLQFYQQWGLKTGDARIATFCEQEQIHIFVSENRHFLHELPERSFEIINCRTFCERFHLTAK